MSHSAMIEAADVESDFDDFDDDGQRYSDPDYAQSSDSNEGEGAEGEDDEDEEDEGENGGQREASTVGESTAEMEIEGDFDRLVQDIRGTDGSSGAGLLSKVWDFNMEEKVYEFRDDLRAASGIGRRSAKRTRHTGPPLSHQVRTLIGEGNQAYVDCNIPEAVRIMQEVIRIEPRASSAWSVLAQCYEDQNEPQKALQLRIMAAHLRHDAEEWERLARQSRLLGYHQQALYCFGKLCSLDPTNIDAFWDRASLAKEMGELRTARNSLLFILKRFPHDLTVLAELRPILIDLNDFSLCASLFQGAFDHAQSLFPSGPPESSTTTQPPAAPSSLPSQAQSQQLSLLSLLVLADLYNTPTLAAHSKAITTIRRGSRWLQHRSAQKFWDVCEDDREFDPIGTGGAVVQRVGEPPSGGYPLDVNARQRLAVARIKMGDTEEGKMHANIVLLNDVMDYAPLFAEIADAYYDKDLYSDAKPIYELLGADAGTSSLYILMQTAACYRLLGELREAVEVYEHVKMADPQNNDAKMRLAEIYEILNEPRKALELVYEVIDSRKKGVAPRDGTDVGQSGSLFEEKARAAAGKGPKTAASTKAQARLTMTQLKELEAGKEREVLKGYKRAQELWVRLVSSSDSAREEAERAWLLEAEKLVETFRETRNLFLTGRSNPFRGMFPRERRIRQGDPQNEAEEDRMATRLHLDLEHETMARKSKGTDAAAQKVTIFRGVSFDDWLRLFMQYSFLLTKRDHWDLADEVLRHILLSNAYQSRELQDMIRLTLITCAVATKKYLIVVEQARKLIGVHQFNNEPLRILLASLASGMRPTDAFIVSTLQKHILREIKLGDMAVKNPDALKWNALNKRWVTAQGSTSAKGVEADDGLDDDIADENTSENPPPSGGLQDKDKANAPRAEIPTKSNPYIVALYGQICIAAKSYQSAIFYLLHAYDYCPDDPVICLSLAIASIGRAMQRQSDNRHHLIAQAAAFLSKYREIRGSDVDGLDEVEFNFGRAFQQLGLNSLAVKHYERVLSLAENKPAEHCGLAKEAAYNLSLIFVMTGATPLAEALYRRWLSF